MKPQVRTRSQSMPSMPIAPAMIAFPKPSKRKEPSTSTRMEGSVLASPISYKELIKGLGLEFEAKPSTWRKAVDHATETVVFFQLDLGGDRPRISKSIVIRPERNVEMLCLVPSVFTEDSRLHSSHIRNAMGRTYLQDGTDLMKLLDYIGALNVDEESEEEPSPPRKSVRSRCPTPYRSSSAVSEAGDDLSETDVPDGHAPSNVRLHGTVSSDDQGSVQSAEIIERPPKRKLTAVSTGHAESKVGQHSRGKTLPVGDDAPLEDGSVVSGTRRRSLRTRGNGNPVALGAEGSRSGRPLISSSETVSPDTRKLQRHATAPQPPERGPGGKKGYGKLYRVWDPRQGMAALQEETMRTHIKNVAAKGYKCWEYPCCGTLQFAGTTTTIYRHMYGREKHSSLPLRACKHYRAEHRRRYLLGYPPAGVIRTFYLVNSPEIDVSVREREAVYTPPIPDRPHTMYIAKEDVVDATTLTDRVEALQADGRLNVSASIEEILDCLDAQDRLAAQGQ